MPRRRFLRACAYSVAFQEKTRTARSVNRGVDVSYVASVTNNKPPTLSLADPASQTGGFLRERYITSCSGALNGDNGLVTGLPTSSARPGKALLLKVRVSRRMFRFLSWPFFSPKPSASIFPLFFHSSKNGGADTEYYSHAQEVSGPGTAVVVNTGVQPDESLYFIGDLYAVENPSVGGQVIITS